MKSMTGFGKGSTNVGPYQLEVEIKSVNHRFLDIQLRLPREFNAFEMDLRQQIKTSLKRGRVECWVHLKKAGAETQELVINWALLDQLVKELNEAKTHRYTGLDFNPSALMSQVVGLEAFFSVVEKEETEIDLATYLTNTLAEALQHLNDSRGKEGKHLNQALTGYLADFKGTLAKLGEHGSTFEKEHYAKLVAKVKEMTGEEVDESRILTEVALLLERGDINEELDRLVIHCQNFTELLGKPAAVGREMDFLIQEMNREVNTVGSKSSPIEIKELVVEMKTILEKIREQVQNVE